jgi:hypothetical protein
MNEIKALAARLLQNPDLVKSIVRNPQAVAQLAGLDEGKIKALAGLGKTLSGLLSGSGKPATTRASPARAPRSHSTGAGSVGVRNTAIVSAVSLTAITGAVVAVGTVSAVALSKGRKARTP